MVDPTPYVESFSKLAQNVGIPTALLLFVVLAGCGFMFIILRFLKPFVVQWFEKQFAMMDNVVARINEVPAMAKADTEGHKTTHDGLHVLTEQHKESHGMIRDIHKKVVG